MKRILFAGLCIFSTITTVLAQPNREVQDSLRKLSEEDHKALMAMLGISSLRQGANGSNPNAPNAANYDESKANPFPNLPDPLKLKNGAAVKTPDAWWKTRRAEIIEDFDREIYGRRATSYFRERW